jgi:glycosyltransferase involved in cell wall biosynthesis
MASLGSQRIRQAHRNALTMQTNELKGKTLLFVDYALPMYDRYAGSRTNYMYLLVLIKMGMKVIYLPADFKHIEPYSTELDNLGVEILAGEWFQDNWKDWIKEKGSEIDYVFLHKPDPAIQFLEDIYNHTNAAVIYQCHDLHYLRMQRQAELSNDHILLEEANFFREKENYLFSVCDVLLTFSSVENEIIRKFFPCKQVYTVPLFFYEEEPVQKLDFDKRRGLLYVGGFDHVPNRDAVLWFCNEVLPLVLRRAPDIVFHVVGADPPETINALRSANVKIHGKVSEEQLCGSI